jgi:hypothetical protein
VASIVTYRMPSNPYESPQSSDATAVPAVTKARRGAGAMFALGGSLGALIGGAFGAAGAGLLAFAFVGVHPERFIRPDPEHPGRMEDERYLVVLVGALLGGEVGIVAGGILGMGLGVVSAMSRIDRRSTLWIWSVCISALIGAVAGLYAANILAADNPNRTIWCAVGAAIGGLSASVGGWLLTRLVCRMSRAGMVRAG